MSDGFPDVHKDKTPGVNQTPGLCGPASLKSILGFFGLDVELSELAKVSGATEESGVEAEGLLKAAKHYGFDGRIVTEASIDKLRSVIDSGIPAIVDWWKEDDGHYSVVTDMNDTELQLMDPESGESVWMTIEEFEPIWFDFPIGDSEHQHPINKRMIVISPKAKESTANWKKYLRSKALYNRDSESAFHSSMRKLDDFIAARVPSTKGMIWRNGKINPNATIADVDAALTLLSKFGQATLDALGDPSEPDRLSGTPMNNLSISQEDSKLDEWSPSNNQNQGRADNFVPNTPTSSGKKTEQKAPEKQPQAPTIDERMKALTNLIENVEK
jgi:uncharacterized protein